MEELSTGYGLVEGPVYDPQRGLVFSDVLNGGVHALNLSTGAVETLIPHRRGIGGMAPHISGGFVVSGRNVAVKIPGQEGTHVLLDAKDAGDAAGFNDLTTDAAGRIYVGSLGFVAVDPNAVKKPGLLCMIDVDGSAHTLASGIQLTNGIAVSADGKRLYHNDLDAHTTLVYALHDDGTVGEKQPLIVHPNDGHPDGMAVAQDGSIWIAMAHHGCVRVFNPDGSERRKLDVPLPMVTSMCFGGSDLQELFIVTGSVGAGRENAGTIYRERVDVPGVPIHPARMPLG
jgi:gluconolactonase